MLVIFLVFFPLIPACLPCICMYVCCCKISRVGLILLCIVCMYACRSAVVRVQQTQTNQIKSRRARSTTRVPVLVFQLSRTSRWELDILLLLVAWFAALCTPRGVVVGAPSWTSLSWSRLGDLPLGVQTRTSPGSAITYSTLEPRHHCSPSGVR